MDNLKHDDQVDGHCPMAEQQVVTTMLDQVGKQMADMLADLQTAREQRKIMTRLLFCLIEQRGGFAEVPLETYLAMSDHDRLSINTTPEGRMIMQTFHIAAEPPNRMN